MNGKAHDVIGRNVAMTRREVSFEKAQCPGRRGSLLPTGSPTIILAIRHLFARRSCLGEERLTLLDPSRDAAINERPSSCPTRDSVCKTCSTRVVWKESEVVHGCCETSKPLAR
jgi:hypothetical protein